MRESNRVLTEIIKHSREAELRSEDIYIKHKKLNAENLDISSEYHKFASYV